MTFEATQPRFGGGVAAGSVRIFDTTLRDGEQAPGAGLTAAEKLEVARQLARLRVDVIEAGFPAASPGDFEAVRRIAQETKGGIAVAALARCRDGDPQRAVEAIGVAERPHLHLFIATSDIHLKHKLKMSREDALADARKWVELGARDAGPRRRDRVLRRGRVPDRGVVPARGLRGRRRGGRLDRQHPRHRRLRDPGRVRRARRPRRRPRRPRRDRQRPLPQRPGPRDREHARRRPGGRPPGRGHHQRPRRARRQRVAGGGRDGPPDAPQPVPGARRPGPDRAAHPGLAAGVVPHRLRGPAQQGHRRRQRVRARVRDPPGRVPQEPADLRDHDPAVRGAVGQHAVDRQAVRPPRAPGQAAASSATRSTARRSTRSTARRSRSRTRRRTSPTRT